MNKSLAINLLFVFILGICLNTQILSQSSGKQIFEIAKDLKANNKKTKARKAFAEALTYAEKENKIQLQIDCHLNLAELTDNLINYKKSIEHYKAFASLYQKQMTQKNRSLKKSVKNLKEEIVDVEEEITEVEKKVDIKTKQIDELIQDSTEQIQKIEQLSRENLISELKVQSLELENQKKIVELAEFENKRNIMLALIAIIIIILSFLLFGYLRKRKHNGLLLEKNNEIAEEKDKSEDLLLNILPRSVAIELIDKGKTTPHLFEEATVIFTDFKGFTSYASDHSPEEVVSKLDLCFSEFDRIVSKHKIEKIKTIGDAYLCVSGLPNKSKDHIGNAIEAAKEFMEFINRMKKEHAKDGADFFEMRIGLHIGPLVAGVVGSKKFAYDIWGDTVNIASRMEHASEPGRINVSHDVYKKSKNSYSFSYRGELDVKNKGMMKMYFLEN